MNTQFNSNVIWLQLEYKIFTLVTFKKVDGNWEDGSLFLHIGPVKKKIFRDLIYFLKIQMKSWPRWSFGIPVHISSLNL